MREINELLNAGNSASQLARQLARYLRNCLMAKLGGEATELLEISVDERARAARSAALFSEEDLTRFLAIILRTFDELNYRQEQRFHLELGLLKLVHLERLLPLEQILSSLPGAGPPPAPSKGPIARPPKTPLNHASAAPPAVPPAPQARPAPRDVAGEADARSGNAEAVELDRARDSVVAALVSKGHDTAAALLSAARWSQVAAGVVRAQTGVKNTLLGLAMTPAAVEIAHAALHAEGIAAKLETVPGEAPEHAPNPAPVVLSGSIHEVALGHPLVRQAQELFRAEVRSVLDLRERSQGNARDGNSRDKG
jgi:DNA polymerase-3 subunit gamma/tau